VIANVAFLAAMTVLGVTAWLASELVFLAPYKDTLLRRHGIVLGGVALLTFLNLTAFYYTLARAMFLRETGQKLAHLDRQLPTSDGAHDELRQLLSGENYCNGLRSSRP
jgi:hypothetical protein